MKKNVTNRQSSRGFTLVEILIGLALGLIAIIVMYQTFAVFESQRRTTTTGSDAQTGGLLGLFAMERDGRMAGYGMIYNDPANDTDYSGQLLCTRINWFKSGVGQKRNQTFLPVYIEDNVGPNGSDRITFAYSTSPYASAPMVLAAPVQKSDGTSDPLIVKNAPVSLSGAKVASFCASDGTTCSLKDPWPVDPTTSVQPNDMILVGTPQNISAPLLSTSAEPSNIPSCALLQVTGWATDPAGIKLSASGGNYNPPAGTNIFPIAGQAYSPSSAAPYSGAVEADGYQSGSVNQSVVVNMGRMAWNRYSVNRVLNGTTATDRYELTVENLLQATGEQVSVGDSIVGLYAQYGLAPLNCTTQAPPPSALGTTSNCQNVTSWVNPNNKNADGLNWGNPTPNMVARIKAVRIAVIARSSLPEKLTSEGGNYQGAAACSSTTSATPTGVCAWVGDAANPAPAVDLTGIANWDRYRYRVYETTIPLRNVLWGVL